MQMIVCYEVKALEKFYNTVSDKKVAFIGAGVNHRDLIPLFVQAGAQVTLCDHKLLEDLGELGEHLMSLGVRLSLGESYLEGLAGQDMVLRTPGFNYTTPALIAIQASGVCVTSEMELFFAHCPCPIIGITGSDGKTTTTSLIAAMYKAAGHTVHLGGNLGRPLLPIVDDIKVNDIVIVELSSFQLGSMQLSPKTAVVTNVTPNHLDYHSNMQEYIDAKKNILTYQSSNGVAVLGYENETSRSFKADVRGELRWFSRLNPVDNGACLNSEGWLCIAKNGKLEPVVPKSEVALRGEHNIENLLAAFATVRDALPVAVMAETARSFTGVEHRIEPVRMLNGVMWYNDSIATSPTRVIAGLRAFNQKLIVIAGGYDKNIPFQPMAKDVVERVKVLILMGPTAHKIEAAVKAEPGFAESGPAIYHVENMGQAVQKAYALAHPDDIVTLSPACASFDAYPNFEARGQHYKQLVNAL